MVILGIDPGLAIVGYSIIGVTDNKPELIECGVIKTLASLSDAERLSCISGDIEYLIKKFQPEYLSIEELFFNKNIKTGISVAEARGVIIYKAFQAGLIIKEYNPLQVKTCITGDGKADKLQVQYMVKQTLDLDSLPKPDDAADAIAIGLTLAYELRI